MIGLLLDPAIMSPLPGGACGGRLIGRPLAFYLRMGRRFKQARDQAAYLLRNCLVDRWRGRLIRYFFALVAHASSLLITMSIDQKCRSALKARKVNGIDDPAANQSINQRGVS